MLRVSQLKFSRGDEVLFEDLSFVVHPGQRVAIAGRNGVGKTTLFNLLRGTLTADTGDIDLPSNWHIGAMAQDVPVTDRPALDFAVDGHARLRAVEARIEATQDPHRLASLHAEYQDLGGYEAEAVAGEVLHGLGFQTEDLVKPYSHFSGGWRIRLNLAQALMNPCELLLLDEPTNHLDLEAILWLENWLQRFDGTVLLIAHDRAFLDAATNHTLYLSRRRGELFNGNYSACERQRAERLVLEQAIAEKQRAQAAHIQKFVDRFRAKASKAKQVQSRIKALERMQLTQTIQLESAYSVTFNDPDKVSNPLFTLRDVALGYDDKVVLEHVSQTILPGARIGVLGVNGAGKSTLLKAIVGDLEPQAGELTRGRHAAIGYFAQHQLENLDARNTALVTLTRHNPEWTEQRCRDYLGGWGFDAGMVSRPIETLSGGEKARLVLALLAIEAPAVLVLDEPTNHLDLDMRDALGLALQDYEGAVIIVSHDRNMLEVCVNEFWLLEAGTLHAFDGDIRDYSTAKVSTSAAAAPVSTYSRANDPQETPPEAAQTRSKKAQRQARAEQRQAQSTLRAEVQSLEREMTAVAEELKAIEAQLADKATYDTLPKDELDHLIARSGRRRAKLQDIEERWLIASERLEARKSR